MQVMNYGIKVEGFPGVGRGSVTIRPLLKLAVPSRGLLRALSESQFFAQQKMVELRSSLEGTASLRPSPTRGLPLGTLPRR